tara:strand:+ start:750 stop:953 length:204 start_codon:yes stop_codon:yes gene_type:complete
MILMAVVVFLTKNSHLESSDNLNLTPPHQEEDTDQLLVNPDLDLISETQNPLLKLSRLSLHQEVPEE